MKRSIIITGGAGFIGSNLIRHFVTKYPDYMIINVDKLTYCGDLSNLSGIELLSNYKFIHADICDYSKMLDIMKENNVDGIIHLAAESHVDNSIKNPFVFAATNVMGTLTLLQAAKTYWEGLPEKFNGKCFYHVSTDEVYGALEVDLPEGKSLESNGISHVAYGSEFFTEETKYAPHSPYSASKASSDHFVRAFHDTYGLPIRISNCSNNYGPRQYPEKLLPLFINNIIEKKPLPVYGEGLAVRDWLYVDDHCKAIDLIFHKGTNGSTYNIGGFNEKRNIDVIKILINEVDKQLGRKEGEDLDLITHVEDRLGHDQRYAIDSTKLREELGWKPETCFEEGIVKTVSWYLSEKKL